MFREEASSSNEPMGNRSAGQSSASLRAEHAKHETKRPTGTAPYQPRGTMRLVLVSDSHCRHRHLDVPDGDVFIHAGDFTYFGKATTL